MQQPTVSDPLGDNAALLRQVRRLLVVVEAVGQTDAVCDFLCVGHKVMIFG
jgi:hypothetical protein